MARSIVLGNGRMLVGLDESANLRDLYFPMVGLENQVGEALCHRIGVWVNGVFSWLGDDGWQIDCALEEDTLESRVEATHPELEVELTFCDAVYNEEDVFLRKVEVTNLAKSQRDIRLFFAHEFSPYASNTAHTAYFDPIQKALVHYKGRRAFLINARLEDEIWHDYTTGVFGIEGKDGSYKDAEDGALGQNAIEHGPADSVLGLYGLYQAEETKVAHYWITAAKEIREAVELNGIVLKKTPEHMLGSTRDFWRSWTNKREFHFPGLEQECVDLFRSSLLIARAHTNNNGAVIASSDSGMLQKGKDTYAYVWPRDSAFVMLALSGAGYQAITEQFFRFSREIVEPMGYFMHKYNADGSLGSSWHPWVKNGKFELPIQKDETALVLHAFWKYYEESRNLELVEDFYKPLIEKTADFLCEYKDEHTNLPSPSYDLWEERFGIHTFTCASIYSALIAASNFARLLGKKKQARKWSARADEIREAILEHLYDDERELFYRMINVSYEDESDLRLENPRVEADGTIDASTGYGLFYFGVLDPEDERLEKMMAKTKKALGHQKGGMVGGVGRYEYDDYHRVDPNDSGGNPWFITTLWYAQYLIERAKSEKDLKEPCEWIHWAKDHTENSGVMAEQLDPNTGFSVSTTPLTWSHGEYVRTVLAYLNKLEALGLCSDCNPVNS